MTRDRTVPTMRRDAVEAQDEATAPRRVLALPVLAGFRSALRTRPRRGLVALTVVTGGLSAVAAATGTDVGERTFAQVSGPAQSVMSVLVPFLGVLLVQDLRGPRSRSALVSVVLSALTVSFLLAVVGVALCGVVTALAESRAPQGRWEHAGTVVVGSLLVQALAQLTGTGFGQLARRPAVACLLTIVLPLGLWLLLGASNRLRPAQAWLTPFASARNLLAGDMGIVRWAQWLLVVAIWGIGLNVVGWLRTSRAQQHP